MPDLLMLFTITRNLIIPNRCLPQPAPVSYTLDQIMHLNFYHFQSRANSYKYSFLPRTTTEYLKIDRINTINLDTFKNT